MFRFGIKYLVLSIETSRSASMAGVNAGSKYLILKSKYFTYPVIK